MQSIIVGELETIVEMIKELKSVIGVEVCIQTMRYLREIK